MINKYFLKEVLPHFISAFIVFCSILVISQLVRLTEGLITFGISAENILLPFLFILLPFVSVNVPMAYFFAVMIATSRLSADGEVTAFLASGYSLRKIARPFVLIGTILFILTASCAMYLESWGRREFIQFQIRKAQTALDGMIKFRLQEGVFLSDFLEYTVYAEKISPLRDQLENFMIAPGPGSNSHFVLLAPKAEIQGSVEKGNMKMIIHNGRLNSNVPGTDDVRVVKFGRAEIDLLKFFQQQIFGDDYASDDYRGLRPQELLNYIDSVKNKPEERENYLKSRYLVHFRLSSPFTLIAFSLLGIVLGFQGQRHSKNFGYIGTILSIMITYLIIMGAKWLGENGHVNIPLAAWGSQLLILSIAVFIFWQKNRLPIGENPIALKNLPFFNKKDS